MDISRRKLLAGVSAVAIAAPMGRSYLCRAGGLVPLGWIDTAHGATELDDAAVADAWRMTVSQPLIVWPRIGIPRIEWSEHGDPNTWGDPSLSRSDDKHVVVLLNGQHNQFVDGKGRTVDLRTVYEDGELIEYHYTVGKGDE